MEYKRLRNLREDHDYTQKKIADILQIGRTQYNLYENGKRDIPVDLLRILAELYNTSIDYLVELTDIPDRYPKSNKKQK